MMASEEEKFEEIKNWFEEAINNEEGSSIDHGLKRMPTPPPSPTLRQKIRARESTPPWVYCLIERYRKRNGRKAKHGRFAQWLRKKQRYTPAQLRRLQKMYFPEWTDDEDDDVLFEAEMRAQRPQNQEEILEEQQPTTSSAANNARMPDLITIDDEEETGQTPPTSGRISVLTMDSDEELDVLTLDHRPGSRRTAKRTTEKSSNCSPERKKPKRRAGKRVAASEKAGAKGTAKISAYFPSLTIK